MAVQYRLGHSKSLLGAKYQHFFFFMASSVCFLGFWGVFLKRETVFVAAGKYTDEKTIISFPMKTKLKSLSQVLLNT